MGRKRPDPDDLAAALSVPAFESSTEEGEASSIHQLLPTTLVLTLDQLKPYEHNPRRAENPEYDRLVDSIRARRGLTTPLTVTKRPGEDLYTIAAGGNSRLAALRELYEATADVSFYRVSCRVEPSSEASCVPGTLGPGLPSMLSFTSPPRNPAEGSILPSTLAASSAAM